MQRRRRASKEAAAIRGGSLKALAGAPKPAKRNRRSPQPNQYTLAPKLPRGLHEPPKQLLEPVLPPPKSPDKTDQAATGTQEAAGVGAGEAPRHLGRGQPSKLSHNTTERICDSLRVGAFIETAAVYAGVSKSVLYLWMEIGHEARRKKKAGIKRTNREKLCRHFLDSVEQAIADSEVTDLTSIASASILNWAAAAWRLERRFPERWGPRLKVTDGSQPGQTQQPGDGAAIESGQVVVIKLGRRPMTLDRMLPETVDAQVIEPSGRKPSNGDG